MQGRDVGPGRVAELDGAELEHAIGGLGQWRWRGGRLDGRLGDQQLVQALGGTGGAQQIAIDFRQRPEGAGEEAAIEDEGRDGAAGDATRRDVDRALPDDHGDGREHQGDNDEGHQRPEADPALGGAEHGFGGLSEALGLAPLLVEGLDDLHRPEHLAGQRADVGDAVLAVAGNGADPSPEQGQGHDDQGNAEQHHGGELGRQHEQYDGAGGAHDDVAQRHRDGGADDLLDDGGVDGDAAGDLGRAILLEEAGGHAQQIAVHGQPDVGDDPLADPRDEIEADGGGERHRQHQHQQIFEPAADVATAREAFVDDQLEGIGHARRRRRRDQQGDAGGEQLPRVMQRLAPHHAEAGKAALARL